MKHNTRGTMNRLHEQVRQALSAVGMTQEAVSDRFGVSPQQVSNWLSGRTLMTEKQVRALARILKQDPDRWADLALLERAGRKHPRGRERLEQLAFGTEGEGRRGLPARNAIPFQLCELPCAADVEMFTVPAPTTSPHPANTILVCENSRPKVDGARVLALISGSWRVVDYIAGAMADAPVYKIIDEQ